MGLVNALRRIRGLQTPSDPASSSPRRRRSRNNGPNLHSQQEGTSHPRRGRFHPSVYRHPGQVASTRSAMTSEQRRQRDRKDQERVVVESYRTHALEIADNIMLLFPQLDADPANVVLRSDLMHMRKELNKALESYRAALGKKSNVGIEQAIIVLEESEKRLFADSISISLAPRASASDEQSPSPTFPPAARTAEYCDEVLTRLDICDHGRQKVTDTPMPYRVSNGYSLIAEREDTRLGSNKPFAYVNGNSTSSGDTYSPSTKNAIATAANSPKILAFENGFPNVSTNPSFSSGDISNESFLEPTSSSQSFATYAELLQSKANGGRSVSSLHQQRGLSKGQDNRNGFPAYTDGNGFYHKNKSVDSRGRPITEWSQVDRTATPEDRRDDVNSESGDEGLMHLVTSRTTTSLHDRAESARSQKDDGHSSDFLATEASESFLDERERGSKGQSWSSYPLSFEHRDCESNLGAGPELEQPTMAQAQNISFASTLYQTRHARVDSITDAGIFLRRSNVRGDGRCLFRALVRCRAVSKGRAIPGERVEREEADRLRERAVEELIRQRELLDRFFVIEGDFRQYLKKMSHPRTYGGEPELLMLAKVLHVPIAVYILKGNSYRQIQVYGKQYRGEPLRILYSDGIHYDALLILEWC